MSLYIVHHELALGSISEHIVDETVVAIASSQLADTQVCFTRDNGHLAEFPGIRRVWEAAQAENGPSHVGYCHAKGASHPVNPAVADWRRYMLYFFLRGPSFSHDLTGVDWMEDPVKGWFFAGNFWWASSEYLRKLPRPEPSPDRNVWEFWVGQGQPTVHNRFSSYNVNHYHTRYRPFRYVGRGT